MRTLENKTVVITGATRGIGRETARICAREGALVGINFRGSAEGAARELAEELKNEYGVQCALLEFDVRDEAALARACDGLAQIDGWVNNAGINLPGLFVTQSAEQVREQIEVNLIGAMNGCRYVIPRMMEHRAGSIVNVGSVTSERVSRGQAVYAATKGALATFSRALAFEYGRKGVRVNCVAPGPVDTDMLRLTKELAGDDVKKRVPLRRFGRPEEPAELIAYLLSERASFVTGAFVSADGGFGIGGVD